MIVLTKNIEMDFFDKERWKVYPVRYSTQVGSCLYNSAYSFFCTHSFLPRSTSRRLESLSEIYFYFKGFYGYQNDARFN